MEKFIRVSDIKYVSDPCKDHDVTVFTAEEIADRTRGVGVWVNNGDKWVCSNCGCGSRERSEFCKYCGARNGR